MLRLGAAKKFSDYAEQMFTPYFMSHLRHVSRLDAVWDDYFLESLKAEIHSRRGKGVRRHVEACNTIPGNWQKFLRIDDYMQG